MENSETVFEAWFTNTGKMMENWKKATGQWSGDQSRMWEATGKMQQQWMDGFQSMLKNMASTSSGGFNPFSHQTTSEAFSNMLKSMDIYTRLFQLWQPAFSQMQNNNFSTQDFWKAVDPAGFRSFVDKLFGIDQAGIMQGFLNQYGQMTNMWTNAMGNAAQSFANAGTNSIPFFQSMSQMDPQTVSKWYADMLNATQRSFAPFMGQTTKGNVPDAETMSQMAERWGKYISKVNDMQALLYKTSMSAWEKTVQAMAERSEQGKKLNSFDEFYAEWSAINEREYVALFNTDEYAALQAELLTLQTEMSAMYEKQMEAFLQPYPLVRRSQLEEVYKVNHELRARINELERQIAELRELVQSGGPAENNKNPKKDK